MLILVKYNTTTIAFDVNPTDTIVEIKELFHRQKKINPYFQDLKYKDVSLQNEKTLLDYNIQNLSILYLINIVNDFIKLYETCVSTIIEGNGLEKDYIFAINMMKIYRESMRFDVIDFSFADNLTKMQEITDLFVLSLIVSPEGRELYEVIEEELDDENNQKVDKVDDDEDNEEDENDDTGNNNTGADEDN